MKKSLLFFVLGWICMPFTTQVCAGGDDTTVAARHQTPPALVNQGKKLFQKFCAHCHGINGDGDGYNAEFLDKEPAELSDAKFQRKKTNHQIFRVIQKGGAGVRKSHLMPPFGKTLSQAEIWALVAYIRSFSEDGSHPVSLPEDVENERPRHPPVTQEELEAFAQWLIETDSDPETLKRGEKLFKKKKSCFACHRIGEEGGKIGPELTRAGFFYSPEWVYAWVSHPQAYKSETQMPDVALESEDARAIAAYLKSLQPEEAPIPEEWKPYLETPGDPERGRALFFDPEGVVYCSKCHKVDGEGGEVGPDLSHVGSSRTPGFLLESLIDPKAVITAGYATVLILTKERKFITGIKLREDDQGLDIIDKEGNELHIPKETIKKYKTQKISMMPGNFKDLLEVQDVADLLAYLRSLTLREFAGGS